MPAIFVETVLTTATVNNNIYSGSAFEFSRGRNVIALGIVQSATGMFATIQSGSDIIVEEFSLPIKTTYPIIPDEMYFADVMENGDRLVGRVRNPTGGSLTVRSVVQMSQI